MKQLIIILDVITSQTSAGAARHHHALPGHIARFGRQQELDDSRNIFGHTQTFDSHAVCCTLFVGTPQGVAEFGLDQAGADAIDSDVVIQQFFAQDFGHGNQHGLGDCVVSDNSRQVVARIAGQNDNRALLLFEMRNGLLDEEKGALVIDVQHFLYLLVLGIEEGSHLRRNRCIGHQVIDLAVLLQGLVDESTPVLRLPHMAHNPMSLKAFPLDLIDSVLNVLAVSARNDDLHPFFCQSQGDGLSDARRRSSDDGYFPPHCDDKNNIKISFFPANQKCQGFLQTLSSIFLFSTISSMNLQIPMLIRYRICLIPGIDGKGAQEGKREHCVHEIYLEIFLPDVPPILTSQVHTVKLQDLYFFEVWTVFEEFYELLAFDSK